MLKVSIDKVNINAFLFSILPDMAENIPTNFLGEKRFPAFSSPYKMNPNFDISHIICKFLG